MTTIQAATGSLEQNVPPLVAADEQNPTQFRISQVQVLNWGAYSGLQTMTVARSGTAIVGPSGRGKSTLLDAMTSVILPNPQEFNQAARDDRGKKRERTVYSFARGHTDQRHDKNGRSATTNYLRPPGGPGFPAVPRSHGRPVTGAAPPHSAWHGSARTPMGRRRSTPPPCTDSSTTACRHLVFEPHR